jgi:hypothetical protein
MSPVTSPRRSPSSRRRRLIKRTVRRCEQAKPAHC